MRVQGVGSGWVSLRVVEHKGCDADDSVIATQYCRCSRYCTVLNKYWSCLLLADAHMLQYHCNTELWQHWADELR